MGVLDNERDLEKYIDFGQLIPEDVFVEKSSQESEKLLYLDPAGVEFVNSFAI